MKGAERALVHKEQLAHGLFIDFGVLLFGRDVAGHGVCFERLAVRAADRCVDEPYADWIAVLCVDHPEVVRDPRFAGADAAEELPEPLVVFFMELEQQ